MIGVIVVAIAAIICVLFNVTSINYVKKQVRHQQVSQDIDGLLQTSVSFINNTFAQYGGAQQFLREKCASTGDLFKANPVITPDCLDSGFETYFNLRKSGPANDVRRRLNMILWPNDGFTMNFIVTPFKGGARPNDFVPVTTPTPLYDFSHLQVDMMISSPNPNNPAEQTPIRKYTFTISI